MAQGREGAHCDSRWVLERKKPTLSLDKTNKYSSYVCYDESNLTFAGGTVRAIGGTHMVGIGCMDRNFKSYYGGNKIVFSGGVVADEERAMYVSAKAFQNRYISLLWNVRSFRGII